jgi:hypothetical protein
MLASRNPTNPSLGTVVGLAAVTLVAGYVAYVVFTQQEKKQRGAPGNGGQSNDIEGRIVGADGIQWVYLVENGKKRLIPDATTLARLLRERNQNAPIMIDRDVLVNLPEGDPIPGGATQPPPSPKPTSGPIIQNYEGCVVIDGGTYYLVQNGRKRHILTLKAADCLGAHRTRCTHYLSGTGSWPSGPDIGESEVCGTTTPSPGGTTTPPPGGTQPPPGGTQPPRQFDFVRDLCDQRVYYLNPDNSVGRYVQSPAELVGKGGIYEPAIGSPDWQSLRRQLGKSTTSCQDNAPAPVSAPAPATSPGQYVYGQIVPRSDGGWSIYGVGGWYPTIDAAKAAGGVWLG